MTHPDVKPSTVILRGLKKRCPRCGLGRLFASWYTLHTRCDRCHLEIEPRDGDTFGFMYLTTAFFTGIILLVMWFVRPDNILLAQSIILVTALTLMIGTLPNRKGLALAVDYLVRCKMSPDPRLQADSSKPTAEHQPPSKVAPIDRPASQPRP